MSAPRNSAPRNSWFRVDASCVTDERVSRLAKALKIHRAQALGHIIAIEAAVTTRVPSGDLAAHADMLAEWAMWTGDEDTFTREFLAYCTDAGILSDYLDRNRGAKEYAEREKERARRNREKARLQREAGRTAPHRGSPHGTPPHTDASGDQEDIEWQAV